jgi:hypothetical protein
VPAQTLTTKHWRQLSAAQLPFDCNLFYVITALIRLYLLGKGLSATFHHSAYLIAYGRFLKTSLRHNSGLARPNIKGNDVFRVTIHDDVSVVRDH